MEHSFKLDITEIAESGVVLVPAGLEHVPRWTPACLGCARGILRDCTSSTRAPQSREHFVALPWRYSFIRFEVGWGQLVVQISSMGVSDLQPDLRIPELDALLGSFQS